MGTVDSRGSNNKMVAEKTGCIIWLTEYSTPIIRTVKGKNMAEPWWNRTWYKPSNWPAPPTAGPSWAPMKLPAPPMPPSSSSRGTQSHTEPKTGLATSTIPAYDQTCGPRRQYGVNQEDRQLPWNAGSTWGWVTSQSTTNPSGSAINPCQTATNPCQTAANPSQSTTKPSGSTTNSSQSTTNPVPEIPKPDFLA